MFPEKSSTNPQSERISGAAVASLEQIVQIHPTRRCNLRCRHCYSESAPSERATLGYHTLEEVITDAWEQGYMVASFSGGEPILYSELGRLLRHAKSLGMRTTVTSNGMLLNGARLEMLTGCADVLAISLDGVPASHDRMRSRPGAFDAMAANLESVRASGIDFGFIFTLTQFNVHETGWAANFAMSQGAKLFQIHPLEKVGRAAEQLSGATPDETESAYAFVQAMRIGEAYGDRMRVQLDVFHRDLVTRYPEHFHADDGPGKRTNLAACITPLIVEPDGVLVPYGYGFSRKYAIGCVQQQRLRELASPWMTEVYPQFRALCREVYAEACAPSKLPFLNWYEMIHLRSLDS